NVRRSRKNIIANGSAKVNFRPKPEASDEAERNHGRHGADGRGRGGAAGTATSIADLKFQSCVSNSLALSVSSVVHPQSTCPPFAAAAGRLGGSGLAAIARSFPHRAALRRRRAR